MKLSMIYVILPFLTLFIVSRIKVKNIDSEKLILFFFAVSYIFLCGLRDGGGADDLSYRAYYEKGYGGNILQMFSGKEPLFNLLRIICTTLGMNYKGLFLAYAVITVAFLCAALSNCRLDKDDLILYIAAFYFVSFSGMFTTMRQAAAMSMLFYLKSCHNLSWKRRCVLWMLIVCTHYGFIILLPIEVFFALWNGKLNSFVKGLIPICALLVGSFIHLDGLIQKITSTLGLYSYMNDKENFSSATAIGIVAISLFGLYILNLLFESRSSIQVDTGVESKIHESTMLYFSLLFLTANMRWGNRICYYYLLFVPFVVIEFAGHFMINGSSRKLRTVLSLVLYVGFEWIMLGYFGTSGYAWSIRLWGGV